MEPGASPVLARQDFPYENDLYPFPFELAPLSSVSLAKYTYCEADPVHLGRVRSVSSNLVYLVDKMKMLGDLCLTIQKFSITGLIGSNGADKTTKSKTTRGLTDFDSELLDVLEIGPRFSRATALNLLAEGSIPPWLA